MFIVGPDTFCFKTTWVTPDKIIEAFAKIIPDICFVWTWADENRGSNAGRVICENGEISEGYAPDFSEETYKYYAFCWGEVIDDYEDDGNNNDVVADT